MRKILSFLFVSFILSLLFTSTAGAEFSLGEWSYYKDIASGATFEDENVEIDLDDLLLTQVQDLLRDIRIIDNDNEEIPYEVEGEVVRNKSLTADIKEVLIDGENISSYNTRYLKDDNKKSYTYIPASDISNEVSFIFDLGEETTIDRVVFFNYDPFSTWYAVEVEASNDYENWNVVRSRIEDKHQTWLWYGFPRETTYRYFKVILDVRGALKMNEIMLLTRNNSTLNFVANEGKRYKLFYGNHRASLPEYGAVNFTEEFGITKVKLAKQKKNTKFETDSDNDDIFYIKDNCPYTINRDQLDKDNNGIGDSCQEGEFYKEQEVSSESKTGTGIKKEEESKEMDKIIKDLTLGQTQVNDRDADSVSNLFDNCPDKYNPSQLDSDQDGIGDVCDVLKEKEDYSKILITILIVICLFIIFSVGKLSYNSLDKNLEDISLKKKPTVKISSKKKNVKKPTTKKKKPIKKKETKKIVVKKKPRKITKKKTIKTK